MIAMTQSSVEESRDNQTAQMNVLLAFDGSKHADAAVRLVADLNLCEGSKVTALSAIHTQHLMGHEDLKLGLEHVKTRLAIEGVVVETKLIAGNPAATINEYAQTNNVDLTILGAKGLRATLGILLGGVAQQVVEYSCCPVLVVREPYRGIKKVLLVTDGSSYSQSAVECLAPPKDSIKRRLPLSHDVEVTVMHVLPPKISEDMMYRTWAVGPDVMIPIPPNDIDLEALEKKESQAGQILLKRAVDDLMSYGINAKSVLLRGDAATEILQYIQDHEIDLVVTGSRGLSQVTSWLLGSVSRKLVHYASCSVLIVKQPQV